jgi:O-antigen ligase
MLLVTLVLVLLQFLLAMLAPVRFIYLSLWVQTIPYTWNWDTQLVYDTPIGPLNVVAMQMFGFTLACLLALLFHAKGAAEQFKYVRWHAAFIAFCVLSIVYAPSVAYALRMIAKLLGPFLFMILVLVVVRSEDEVRKMRTAILGSGMVLVALALLARAAGINSDPNAIQTGMSGLGPPSMGPPVFSAHMLPVAMLALATFLVERRALMLVIAVTSALAVLGALQRTSAGALYLGFSVIMFAGTRGVWRLLLPVTGLLGLPALMVFSDAFRRRMFFGDATSEQLLVDPQKAANSINGSGRFDLWDAVLRRFFDPNPLLGSGIGSTQEFFYTRFGAGVVHSEYVRLLCEVGLLGLTLFLLALASYLWRMRGNWRRAASPGSRLSGLAAMGGIICYAVYCATDNSFDYVTQFGIYVFGMVAIAIKSSELPSTARQTAESAMPAVPFPNLLR